MDKIIYAEDINYWKTSQTSPDVWIDKTKKLISDLGGRILAEGYGSEPMTGRAAYMLGFEIKGDQFKVIWPVLPTRKKTDERAARIQAATMLFHDTKAKCLSASVKGTRAAFFEYMLLPDGRTAVQATVPELSAGIPALFSGPQLTTGNDDIVEGKFTES